MLKRLWRVKRAASAPTRVRWEGDGAWVELCESDGSYVVTDGAGFEKPCASLVEALDVSYARQSIAEGNAEWSQRRDERYEGESQDVNEALAHLRERALEVRDSDVARMIDGAIESRDLARMRSVIEVMAALPDIRKKNLIG